MLHACVRKFDVTGTVEIFFWEVTVPVPEWLCLDP